MNFMLKTCPYLIFHHTLLSVLCSDRIFTLALISQIAHRMYMLMSAYYQRTITYSEISTVFPLSNMSMAENE